MQLATYRRNDDTNAPLALPPPSPTTQTRERLLALTSDWGRGGSHGSAFVKAMEGFFAGISNENTRRAYAYALLEFWDWTRATRSGAAPLPDQIERRTASVYADWLRTRTHGLEELRLNEAASAARAGRRSASATGDPREPEVTAALYTFLLKHPGSDILAIRDDLRFGGTRVALDELERSRPEALAHLLACLTERHLIVRTPTVEELRRADPTLTSHARIGQVIDPRIFRYAVPEKPQGQSRASTVTHRLAVLSSFWDYLITKSGENTGPDVALLKHNIWKDALRTASKGVTSHQRVVQMQTTPDIVLFEQVLATTAGSSDFDDLRDRAVLLALRWTAVRATELGTLRRRDITSSVVDEGTGSTVRHMIRVLGKGGKTRTFQVPAPVMEALEALSSKLAELAEAAERRQPGTIPRTRRLLEPDAPLFPALMYWGCNAKIEHKDEVGLSRSGYARLLRRRGMQAGIHPGTEAWRRLHLHGWRHLAARDALARGVATNVVQAVLGHASLATTSRYVAIMDLDRHSLADAGATRTPPPTVPTAGPPPQAPVRAPTAPAPPRGPVATVPAAAPQPPPAAPARPVRRIIETVGVSVPDPVAPPRQPPPAAPAPPSPPVTPKAERIVAVGAVAPLAVPLPSMMEQAGVDQATLNEAYGSKWGEQKASSGREKLRAGARREIAGGEEEDDLLTHAYRARTSGLVWWGGPSGALKPEMPVIAPMQVIDGANAGSVVRGLEDLWVTWVDNDAVDPSGAPVERGPTAARALLQWVRVALRVMEQVEAERIEHHAEWVPFAAPIAETAVAPKEAWTTLRVHRDDRVVKWFAARAYVFSVALGRETKGKTAKKRSLGQVIDTGAPDKGFRPSADDKGISLDWYTHADPVGELPPEERFELLDWLATLTGQAPKDTTKRFPRTPAGTEPVLSRIDLSRLLGTFCAYDNAFDDLDELERSGGKDRDGIRVAKESLVLLSGEAKKQVKALTGGAVSDFDLAKWVKDRGARNWALQEAGAIRKAKAMRDEDLPPDEIQKAKDEIRKAREGRRDFRMRVLGDLFGPLAANDELLRLQALCGKAPLSGGGLFGGDYKDLFKTDMARTTIVHDPAFAKKFAEATGTHSECVARRIARHLWELRKIDARDVDRWDETARKIDNWAYMSVPCPTPLERELKTRLAGASPTPLRAEVEREQERIRSGELVPLSEEAAFRQQLAVAQVAAMREGTESLAPENLFEEGSGFQWVKNGKNRRIGRYLQNARRWVPSPVLLLVWANLR